MTLLIEADKFKQLNSAHPKFFLNFISSLKWPRLQPRIRNLLQIFRLKGQVRHSSTPHLKQNVRQVFLVLLLDLSKILFRKDENGKQYMTRDAKAACKLLAIDTADLYPR